MTDRCARSLELLREELGRALGDDYSRDIDNRLIVDIVREFEREVAGLETQVWDL